HPGNAAPGATEGPQCFGPGCQQQHGGVGVGPGVGEPHPHPVADPEVGTDRRNGFGVHLTVSSFSPLARTPPPAGGEPECDSWTRLLPGRGYGRAGRGASPCSSAEGWPARRLAICARAAATRSSLVLAWPSRPQPPSGASVSSTQVRLASVGAPAAPAGMGGNCPAPPPPLR